MGVYIFSKKEAALKKVFPKDTEFVSQAVSKHKPEDGSITYLDISGLSDANYKTALTQLKKACKETSWGIIDVKGVIKDPAALLFDGASDYLGPGFFKTPKAIDLKRIKTASQWRFLLAGNTGTAAAVKKGTKAGDSLPRTGIKLPSASLFPGWKNMKTGKNMPFYLLYCSLQGKMPLNSRFGEKVFAQLHQRFIACLYQNFQEGEGIVWMDSGKDCLFLIPPKAKNAETVITACFRMLVSAPLIAVEVLGLTIPVNFVFTLHYGPISYCPPGKTGTLVSDAVNYIFHLGPKKAEPGRLTVSAAIPDGSVPKALEDCFISAGEFEGLQTWHTKKFSYVKPWL